MDQQTQRMSIKHQQANTIHLAFEKDYLKNIDFFELMRNCNVCELLKFQFFCDFPIILIALIQRVPQAPLISWAGYSPVSSSWIFWANSFPYQVGHRY